MAKKKYWEVDEGFRKQMLNDFYGIISQLKKPKDAQQFFSDLLTPSESTMIIYRIAIAKKLLQGLTYDEIREELQVGLNTVTSVSRWLNNGFGGYMKELQKAKNQKERRKVMPKEAWEKLKRNYPTHFMVFGLLDDIKRDTNPYRH
jgi:Trp operon repressor